MHHFHKPLAAVAAALFLVLPTAITAEPALLSDPTLATAPYHDAKSSPEARTADLLQRMTLEEKLAYISGTDSMYIRALPRLGIPRIVMSDGPVGCNFRWGRSTAYPAGICTAASWNRDLAHKIGVSLGRDSRARGIHILLTPGVNIHRAPQCGRNFEYAGEDPLLAGQVAASEIQGLQSQGVLATIKHFACNNQETGRYEFDSQVDERTLREIYLPAFQAAIVQGKAWCVMSAYNRLNGPYCTASTFLNLQVLRDEWGFPGILMSDWNATHDTVAAANGGLDLEMPDGAFMNPAKLHQAITDGKVTVATIDTKVRHILYTIIANGFLDHEQQLRDIPLDDPTSAQTALEGARQGIVLLKNQDALLPLDASKIKHIAVIGPNAYPAVWGGGGSSFTDPFQPTSVLEGMVKHAPDVTITFPNYRQITLEYAEQQAAYSAPITMDLFNNLKFEGKPVATRTVERILLDPQGKAPADGLGSNHYSVRWSTRITPTTSGSYVLAAKFDDGMRVFVDDKPVTIINQWFHATPRPAERTHAGRTKTAVLDLIAGKSYALRVEFQQKTGTAIARFGWARQEFGDAVNAAKAADVAVVCVGYGRAYTSDLESETIDRSFALPLGQVELIRQVAAANPRTVVVLNAGGGVDWEDWLAKVPAVLHAWYPGQEGGNAVAEILFGVVNPSGKLPVTFEKRREDNPCSKYFLRPEDNAAKKAVYGEGLFVGYRGYDQNKTEPQFCFGHGLSYTTFDYANLAVSPSTVSGDQTVTATFTVTNTGKRAGAEVAQLYVTDPQCSVPRPPRELKGFERVDLKPGETKTVTITLDRSAFAFFHPETKKWTVEPGRFEVLVGRSSRDLPLTASFEHRN